MTKQEVEKLWLKFNKMRKELKWASYSFLDDPVEKKKVDDIEKLVSEVADNLKRQLENFN